MLGPYPSREWLANRDKSPMVFLLPTYMCSVTSMYLSATRLAAGDIDGKSHAAVASASRDYLLQRYAHWLVAVSSFCEYGRNGFQGQFLV